MIPISFVILNYNGRDLTTECISSLVDSIKDIEYEIIVVDNGSTDGSAQFIKEKFPFVRIIEKESNEFTTAYNDGVLASRFDWVFLFNNDMIFEKNFITPIVDRISELCKKQEGVFAIGSKMLDFQGNFEKGVNLPEFKFGYLRVKTFDALDFCPTFYIGTHGVFNRKKFIEIGGFDKVYKPFYSEDVDLCYRAWKRDWKVYIEPHSIIFHKHMATIGKHFTKRYILIINARNHFVFLWKNLTSRKFILIHILSIPLILIGSIIIGKPYYIVGFLYAIKLLLQGKIKRDLNTSKTDEEVFSYFEGLKCHMSIQLKDTKKS